MVKVSASVVIDRPIETVFEFVSDVGNDVKWSSGVVEVRKLSEGPWAVGTRYTYVRQFLGRKFEVPGELHEFDRPAGFSWRSTGVMEAVGRWEFEPVADGTRATASMEVEARGIFSLAESVVGGMFRRAMATDLENLKTLLESPGGPSGVWAEG